ncbi:ATP-binding protein [Halovivax limisalsi]|uniref:ATP-binding protein n=1 Tax=Halovivax limisalsi TaxID=1453760 RepID=UPI001FFC90AB|nr:ATP-binding protein [Halovivax limisalsi]
MPAPITALYVASPEAPEIGDDRRESVVVERVESIAACRDRLDDVDCVVVGTDLIDGSTVDCCERVADLAPETPIVVYPEAGSEALAGRTVAAGADAYVPTDAGDGVLEARLRNVLADVSDRTAMERTLRAHQRKVATLHDVVSRFETCQTPRAVYEEIVDAAEGVLQFDVCVVSEYDDSMLELAVLSSGTDPDQFERRRSIDDGIGGKTYRTGRTIRVDDVAESAEASPQDPRYRSALSVPIDEYGVFQAISNETGAFDERDVELAELLISHATDALDRIAFEAQLVAERDRFAVLFENVPDAVVMGPHVGSEFIVEEVNSAFEETFGYDMELLEGEPIDDYITPPDRRDEASDINERGEAGEVIETEVKRRTADGLRDFMLRVVPFETEGEGEYAFGLYTDITDQKQRQKRVEVLNRVLRHDLRNGMNIIEGSAERLAALSDKPEAESYARAIRERTAELIDLAAKTRVVERTLDRTDVTGPVDAVEAVETAIDRVRTTYDDPAIRRSLPEGAAVQSDDLLTEAIYNVIENAIEHADGADPTIDISVSTGDSSAGTVTITIADDGPGIPDEERRLLEEEREITQLRHASGLGLWLVDWVVTQAGGELRFEENEPRGTIVELHLPAADGRARSDR